MKNQVSTLGIHWPRLGPYHLARLRAAHRRLGSKGIRVVALEVASQDEVYEWREERVPLGFERYVACPGRVYEQVPVLEMWRGLYRLLQAVEPDAVAINGYGSKDTWALLSWCRVRRRPAILMTESKADDAPRTRWAEALKRFVLRQFVVALCGGSSHRAYLEQLGMRPEQIFDGYDAVDNEYFGREADVARQSPAAYRHLPGLEAGGPFFLASARFIRRKNLDGLLRAYGIYRQRHHGQAPWRLVLLGDGEERGALEGIIRDEGLDGVSLPGFRQIDELPAYYGLAGAFVHPALQDQWGLVVNEAMAAGLPVLVSERCGCAPDLVRQGETGFTFDPEDAEALAALMDVVSSGRVDRQAMGRAAQAHIGRWGPERFAEGMGQALDMATRAR